MKKSSAIILLSATLVTVCPNETASQLKFKLNGESGIFSSKLLDSKELDILLRINGELSYLYKGNNRSAGFQARLRPEIYGFNNISSLKSKFSANYSEWIGNINLGIDVSYQKYIFEDMPESINYGIFAAIGNITWNIDENFYFNGITGYAYQNKKPSGKDNYDLLFVDGFIFHSFNRYFSTGLGMYLENFKSTVNFLQSYTVTTQENSGVKIGPQISIKYLRKNIIIVEYRFSFIDSEITKPDSHENWIRFVAGKLFGDRWSIFLLIDYFIRSITYEQNFNGENYIAVQPENLENKIYLKTAYELSQSAEVYAKIGYFKENYEELSSGFEGLNLVLGLDLMFN